MINSLIENPGWNEFTLEPDTVADAAVSQVLKGESAQLIFPSRVSAATGIRGWPTWLKEVAQGAVAKCSGSQIRQGPRLSVLNFAV